jgi:hypothetical protein
MTIERTKYFCFFIFFWPPAKSPDQYMNTGVRSNRLVILINYLTMIVGHD